MKWLENAWSEVRRGENIDLYLTIIAAIILALTNIIGVDVGRLLNSITLAALALFAFAILGNRHKLELILQEKRMFVTHFPESITGNIENSKELWIIGKNLSTTLNSHYYGIEKQLRGNGQVNALLINPKGQSCSISAEGNFPPQRPEDNKKNILESINLLKKLVTSTKGNLSIRQIDYVIPFNAIMINPKQRNGILYIRNYNFKSPQQQIIVTQDTKEWWDFYKSQIESLWEHGESIKEEPPA